MKQTKSLIFLTCLTMIVVMNPAIAILTPPNMSIKDQMVHSDPFIEMIYQVCSESQPLDVEKCVMLIRRLDKIGGPPETPSGDCSYLILKNTDHVFPCN